GCQGADLGRRLVAWAGHLGVDARQERDAADLGCLLEDVEQARRIGAWARAGETTGTGGPPGPGLRPIDVVAHGHETAGRHRVVDASGGVRQDEDAGAEPAGQMDRPQHRAPGLALVEMNPAFEEQYGLAGPMPKRQATRVARHADRRQPWHLPEAQAKLVF